MKTFKKVIIIRERDLTDLMYKTIKKGLFDRIAVEPLTYQEIQNEILLDTLKGKEQRGYKHLARCLRNTYVQRRQLI